MMDPEQLKNHASHVILHAWVAVYLSGSEAMFSSSQAAGADASPLTAQLQTQANKLRESAILLQAALEKMRIANEKLASRMAEHKAFFAKYKAQQ